MKNTREGILIYDTEEKIYDIRFGWKSIMAGYTVERVLRSMCGDDGFLSA